ncbi:hypothetical protein [Bradyrhizobium sp. AZCC 2289]|uniref:hypothetical protein n=1 Tax=Bradyrhizobium sp. AZCC 2289 TaxID=3117026 RepID=UPI002FF3E857
MTIDAADCRAMLENRRHLDDTSRLMLEIAVRHGNGVMTFGEMKKIALRAVAEAGTIKAAIKVLAKSPAAARVAVVTPGMHAKTRP